MPNNTKPGYKTTEFWVALATGVTGILATLGVITPEAAQGTSGAVGQIAGGVLAGLAALGYGVSRGLAKKG